MILQILKPYSLTSKRKDCSELMEWIKSISNHLWWSAATCNKDPYLLRERWTSIVHHVNKHSWTGANHFTKCAHSPLSRLQQKYSETPIDFHGRKISVPLYRFLFCSHMRLLYKHKTSILFIFTIFFWYRWYWWRIKNLPGSRPEIRIKKPYPVLP